MLLPPVAPANLGALRLYFKTHGTRVTRLHLLDWVMLVVHVALDGVLNSIKPFHWFIREDMVPCQWRT